MRDFLYWEIFERFHTSTLYFGGDFPLIGSRDDYLIKTKFFRLFYTLLKKSNWLYNTRERNFSEPKSTSERLFFFATYKSSNTSKINSRLCHLQSTTDIDIDVRAFEFYLGKLCQNCYKKFQFPLVHSSGRTFWITKFCRSSKRLYFDKNWSISLQSHCKGRAYQILTLI